ncbi:MAG: ATP-binding protein [Vicinamibacterales bacterium]
MNDPEVRARGSGRSLRTRVMLLVGSGTLAALLIMGWIAWSYSAVLTEQLLHEREVVARVVADRVGSVLRHDLELLQGMGQELNLEDEDEAPEQAALTEILRRARLLEHAFLVGRDGRHTLPGPVEAIGTLGGIGEVPGARQAFVSGRPSFSVLLGREADRPTIYALVPLRDWHGDVTALAGGTIDPKSARLTSLFSGAGPGEGASTDLLDDRARVLASTDSSRQFFQTGHRQAVESLVRGRPVGIVNCDDCPVPGGTSDEVAAMAPVSVAPWVVAVRQGADRAYAATVALRRRIASAGIALVLLALLFAWGAAESVRRPLALLTSAAEGIAAGELGRPIPRLPEDEVGRLGRSLERMRTALESSLADIARANAELERRVEDRTRELERLYRQIQEREERRHELLRKVISAQEDERKRLARELHDETSQTLSALAMGLQTSLAAFPSDLSRQRLEEAQNLTVRTLEELHRLIYDLRPSVLDDLGLWSAIRWYAERTLEPLGVTVRYEFTGVERRLPPEWETALFRVVQEAITNVARHGQADIVLIQCAVTDEMVTIEIEDDGLGFDLASLPAVEGSSQRGLGLMGMRERVELLGGTIAIDTAPGQGVHITVSVPVGRETGNNER